MTVFMVQPACILLSQIEKETLTFKFLRQLIITLGVNCWCKYGMNKEHFIVVVERKSVLVHKVTVNTEQILFAHCLKIENITR